MPARLQLAFAFAVGLLAFAMAGCQAILGITGTTLASDASLAQLSDATADAAANDGQLVPDSTVDAPDAAPPDASLPDAAPGVTATLTDPLWVVRGQNLILNVDLDRAGGYSGTASVQLVNLPADVTCTIFRAATGTTTGQLQISATTEAFLGPFQVTLRTISNIGMVDTTVTLEVADGPGVLDESFGGDGMVLLSCAGECNATAVAVQPDGKVVIAGTDASGDWLLERLMIDGEIDATYAGGTTGSLSSLAIVGEGRILAGGVSTGAAIARFASDLSLDATFGNGISGGGVSLHGDPGDTVTSIAIDPLGRIVYTTSPSVGGPTICRVDAEGKTLDPDFNSGSCVSPSVAGGALLSAAVAPDGTLVAVGTAAYGLAPRSTEMAVVRVDASGDLVSAFGTSGFPGVAVLRPLASSAANAVTFSEGLPFVVGFAEATNDPEEYVLARLDAGGTVDTSFAGGFLDGEFFGSGSSLDAVVTQANGMMVAAGYGAASGSSDAGVVVRVTSGGMFDPTFASGGVAGVASDNGDQIHLVAIALAPDGRIVVVGLRAGAVSGVVVARFWP